MGILEGVKEKPASGECLGNDFGMGVLMFSVMIPVRMVSSYRTLYIPGITIEEDAMTGPEILDKSRVSSKQEGLLFRLVANIAEIKSPRGLFTKPVAASTAS
jgi:hypothetical protein